MIVGSNFFIDFEKILRERRSTTNDIVTFNAHERRQTDRFIDRKTADNIAEHYRVARNSFEHAAGLARIFDNAVNFNGADAVCIRKHSPEAEFIKPMNFDARIIKNGDLIPDTRYDFPEAVTKNTHGDLCVIPRNRFKDALTASAQFAFNRLIKARLMHENFTAILHTDWYLAIVKFDGKDDRSDSFKDAQIESVLARIWLEDLPRDDCISVRLGRAMIENTPGKPVHFFRNSSSKFKNLATQTLIDEGIHQCRADLIKLALERKHAQ